MNSENPYVSRRTAIRSGIGAVTAGVVGTGAMLYSSQPALAANIQVWEVDDEVSITTQDGTIDQLSFDPVVTLEYANLEPDREVEFGLFVREAGDFNNNSGQGYPVHTDLHLDGRSGEKTFDLSPAIDVVHRAAFDEEVLFADEPGETNTTEIDVELDVEVLDQEGLEAVEATDTVTVNVTNAAPEATVTGSAEIELTSEKEVD